MNKSSLKKMKETEKNDKVNQTSKNNSSFLYIQILRKSDITYMLLVYQSKWIGTKPKITHI